MVISTALISHNPLPHRNEPTSRVSWLTLTMLWTDSADDKLITFLLFFPENRRQFAWNVILFPGKNRKSISICRLLKFLPRVLLNFKFLLTVSYLTLSLPQAIIIGFCKQHRTRWDGSYEPSHLDLPCLTFSLSILCINFFSSHSLLKKKRKEKQTTNVIWNLAPKELKRSFQRENYEVDYSVL